MKIQATLLAAAAAGLWSTAPMAQSTIYYVETVPGVQTIETVPMYYPPAPASSAPIGLTYSPNPNKAQNSDMRTQSGAGAYAYPSGVYAYPSGVYAYPAAPVWIEPTASSRGMIYYAPTYAPSDRSSPGITYTPNPNRVQNNGVPTQY